jgi:hypothetical protein
VENFAADKLDLHKWTIVRSKDFPGSTIDIEGTANDRHLHMAADTMDLTGNVRYHGIYSNNPIFDLAHSSEFNIDIDWDKSIVDDMANDMSAGFFIVPDVLRDDSDYEGLDYIKVMYRAAIEGPQARLEISVMVGGTLFPIYVEHKMKFRDIGLQHIRLILSKDHLQVWENDKQLCDTIFSEIKGLELPLTWPTAYLHILQTLAPGHPMHDIDISHISIRQIDEKPITVK